MDQTRLDMLKQLADQVGHGFSDWTALDEALRHSSFVHENPQRGPSNERLEFLGDAVLELVVTQELFLRFDQASEGQLSRARSSVVNEARLAEAARQIDLGPCILLGKGEQGQGGQEKTSILADALEAVLAAVYLDGGLEAARDCVLALLGPLDERVIDRAPRRDYKTMLQERVQEDLRLTPRYRTIDESGPDHDKTFSVSIEINDRQLAMGAGKSKKEAEQNAARRGLTNWNADDFR
ncbi:ribonuclease III [Desulfarculus baarsii DSM 2075]|uniref:Ribonuclease 3 n=1 Tax=Desulfarculus baarsii (strain ATCC 33931 / DSM 2075 / LMG 7858 / VKM B-1802 / 2st14) TaxID=644282 RepID=E1QEV1_DESB2|nr:ribonuclease III [Desulfarculus baarsii]ADK84087.1 ribonuclease III [Desulfarculus baarsii DSM 2075]